MPLDFNELRELIAALNQTDIAELTLKSADFELTVRKGMRVGDRLLVPGESEVVAPLPPSAIAAVAPPMAVPSPPPAMVETAPLPSVPPTQKRGVDVTSPLVGTFYRAPGPDEAPFVAVGDRIRVGQVVCIIEAMKVMNEIEAEVSGQITEILVENGQPVEYGQPLMRVNPD